jgi:hypothetical protein
VCCQARTEALTGAFLGRPAPFKTDFGSEFGSQAMINHLVGCVIKL